jgi:uncharacterized protein (TIGR03118 family)
MRSMLSWSAWACACALALSACGGGGGDAGSTAPADTTTSVGTTTTTTAPVTAYAVTDLVADSNAAGSPVRGAFADPNLVNAWGVAFNPQGFVWVNDAGSNDSTLYDGAGVPQSLVVSVPPGSAGHATPTGIVYNGAPQFQVAQNGIRASSLFIFAGMAGTISGWSPGVNLTSAVTVVDDGASGAVYTGLALATQGGAPFLYAADFRHGSVNVFDGAFARATAAGAFVDPALPAGYAPFGLQAIGGLIYVAYAQRDASGRAATAGAGLGIVDTFTTGGAFVKRLIDVGGPLNAPWGLALAPAGFGSFSNALLVANTGDGRIDAFDPSTGALLGTFSQTGGAPIVVDGLHGIAFGNDLNGQPATTLFFAAGPSGGAHGLYGRIDAH